MSVADKWFKAAVNRARQIERRINAELDKQRETDVMWTGGDREQFFPKELELVSKGKRRIWKNKNDSFMGLMYEIKWH
jgi:hypothetical protein